MRNLRVSGGYADFKLVVAALGKTTAVFWWRDGTQAEVMAVLTDGTVRTTVPLPPTTGPLSPTVDQGPLSPLAPAVVPSTASTSTSTTASAAPPGGPSAAPPAKPKTVLETDFPGAIELPGGAIVFS
jgi:hypothetical protein